MPYEVIDHGNGHYSVRDTTYDTGGGSADALTIPGALFYLLGFIGMVIMLFHLPVTMIALGIIAMLIYASPLVMVLIALFMRPFAERKKEDLKLEGGITISYKGSRDDGIFDRSAEPFTYMMCRLLTDGGSVFKNILKNFIAPYAYVLFNLFLAIFWVGYMQGSMSEAAQIAFVIPSAYSMYYYPFVLIRGAIKKRRKSLGIAAGVIIVLSLGVFLAFYDQLINMGGAVGVAVLFSAMTVFGTLALLISNLAFARKKRRHVVLFLLYAVLLVAVIAFAAVVIPAQNEELYRQAEACMEQGDYKQARRLFAELGGYEDAADRYEAIRFVDLQMGEQVTLGTQTDGSDDLYGENPITWTVVAVEDGKALVFCDAILTSIDSNSLTRWDDNNSVRNKLIGLYRGFSEEEQVRVVPHTYTVKDEKGKDVTVTDSLFLLSRAELEQYCTAEQIFAKDDTTYNDHQVLDYQMADLDYTYIYAYYVRDTDGSGEWIVVDCDADGFVSKGSAYRYVGLRPAMYITLDETAK